MQQQAEQEEDKLEVPEWLDHLLRENFFAPCSLHRHFRNNVFCVDCLHALCPQCLLSHSSHRLLQVRRNVYHDTVRLVDAEKLLDCSHVQPYISNGSKVVFLNQRPTTRFNNYHSGNVCAACDRILQDPFLYCSISCKVDHILDNEGLEALYGYLRRCDSLKLNDAVHVVGEVSNDVVVGNRLMTPDSVLEPSSGSAVRSSSNSTGANANAVVSNGAGGTDVMALASTAATRNDSGRILLFPRKKRTPKFPVTRVDPVLLNGSGGSPGCRENHNVNRRKRVPQRSALA